VGLLPPPSPPARAYPGNPQQLGVVLASVRLGSRSEEEEEGAAALGALAPQRDAAARARGAQRRSPQGPSRSPTRCVQLEAREGAGSTRSLMVMHVVHVC